MSEDIYTQRARRGLPVEGFVADMHMHVGEMKSFRVPHWADVDLFVRELDRHGVDVGAISSMPAVLGGLQPGGNGMTLEAVRRFPDRFFGWIGINPSYPDEMAAEMGRCYEAGCRGLKIHVSVGLPYEHENYRRALQFAAERAMPVLAHTWGPEIDALRPYFGDYPTINWTLGHAGCVEAEKYAEVAREFDNVYLDICYSRAPRGLVEFFVEQGVVEKVMFSSDCYFMGLAQQIGRVLFAQVAPEHKAMILGENARRFLGEACPRGADSGGEAP